MSVITISRGSFSGGKMFAKCLSKSLGYRCVDREVIVEGAAAHGVSASSAIRLRWSQILAGTQIVAGGPI